jgi:hypothetical protein
MKATNACQPFGQSLHYRVEQRQQALRGPAREDRFVRLISLFVNHDEIAPGVLKCSFLSVQRGW